MTPSAFPATVRHLTAVVDSVPTAIVVVDEDGLIVLVNRETEGLFNWTREELLGEPVEMLVPTRFRPDHPDLRAGYFARPEARPMGAGRDLYGLRRDGSEVPIEIGLNPIRTEDGLFVVSAIVDISERKRLEARFRATVESAPTAMVMVDQAGTIVLANRETERLFGWDRDELLQRKVEELIPDRFRPGHSSLRSGFFAEPEPRRMGGERDLYALRKDGTEFPVEIGLNPVTTDEGMFVLAAIVDLTERKRAADTQLRAINERLEQSNRDLQEFAYIASHDLQTPLRAISGFVQLLQSRLGDELPDDARDWISRVVAATEHMQVLIRDLLRYSRIDTRPQPFHPVDLQALFEETREFVEESIEALDADVRAEGLPTVMGDRSQLRQLMQNLLDNALKYHGDDPPEVRVTADLEDGTWRITVRDNGIGIPEEHADSVFDPFRRLHTLQSHPGTGIGLAVARRVIERHGGEIWVDKEVESGCTIHFTLPDPEEES